MTHAPTTTALGKFLRERRRALHLSTQEVARRSGINRAQVIRLENGTSTHPAPDTLRSLAAALDLPLSDVWAMAGYHEANLLPGPLPYLRAKYQDLPEAELQRLTQQVADVLAEHGIDNFGHPQPGEDEAPDNPNQRPSRSTERRKPS